MKDQKEVESKIEKYSIDLKNYIYHYQQHVDINMSTKGVSSEGSEGKKKFVTGHWMARYLFYKVAENLAELSSSVMWKV